MKYQWPVEAGVVSQWISALLLFTSLLLIPGSIRAQEFRATVVGQINDSSGALFPGAIVTAVNVDTTGFFTMNAALQKRFQLPSEKMYVQVRLAATNATNSQQLGAPNTNNDQKPNCIAVPVCSGFGTIAPAGTERYGFVSMKLVF